MTAIFSTFDAAHSAIANGLVLSQADQVVQNNSDGSAPVTARCFYPQSVYPSFCEFLVYGDPAFDTTTYSLVGICTAAFDVTGEIGLDGGSNSVAYTGDGTVLIAGGTVASGAPFVIGDVIGVFVNPINNTISFYVNGVFSVDTTMPSPGGSPPAVQPWYPAASLGGFLAHPGFIFFNAGQQRFQYPQPNILGWWIPSALISSIAFATEDFITLDTDANASFAYDGALDGSDAAGLTITREVHFWPWRTSSAAVSGAQSYGSLTLTDPTGAYDFLFSTDARDNPITIQRVPVGGSVDTEGQLIAIAVVDQVQSGGDFKKTITVKDNLAILDRPAQTSLFLPNADPSAAGRPRPICLGACRSVPAILFNASTHTYAIHDAPLGQIASVRVAGKQLSPVGAPPDYTSTPDNTGIILNDDPIGIVTVDASSAFAVIPTTPTDLLSGHGNFHVFTSSAEFTGNWATWWIGTSTPAPAPFRATWGSTPKTVTFPNAGGAGFFTSIAFNSAVIQAGHSYAVVLTFRALFGVDTREADQPSQSYFWYSGNVGLGMPVGWMPAGHWYNTVPADPSSAGGGGGNVHPPATVSAKFTNTQGVNLPLVLTYQASNFVSGGDVAQIDSVFLYEINGPLTVSALAGITLEQYCQHIIEFSANLPASTWASSDAAAIDLATGYHSLGNFISQPTTVRNALQPALDSCGCDLYIDRSGVVRIARLIDPTSVVPLGVIDESVIMGTPTGNISGSQQMSMIGIAADLAPGLSTQFGARRNNKVFTDGDFGATSLADCPNSVRALLKLPFQAIAASGQQLSPTYVYAQQAGAVASVFDDVAEAQSEIDRICALYAVLRNFYYVPVVSALAQNYDIGQVWTLKYPRYGLGTGKPVMIVGISEVPTSEMVTLICWG
jgi:hypothetical protein